MTIQDQLQVLAKAEELRGFLEYMKLREEMQSETMCKGSKVDKTPDPKAEAGSKKRGYSYIPLSGIVALSIGMKAGVGKYGSRNWYTATGHKMNVYLDALQRHLLLLQAGEDYVRDADEYVHHLDAIISGASVLKDLLVFDKCEDDREKMSDDMLNKFAAQVSGESYAQLPIKIKR